jgi:molecular chaperone GrpE
MSGQEQEPAASSDLFLRIRLSRELTELDSRHQAETERLVEVLLGTLSDLDGLAALRHDDAARYRRGAGLVARKLAAGLREAGIELIGVPGEPLDPAIHKVIGIAEGPGIPPDHVTQVLRHGYQYRGRVTAADVLVSALPGEALAEEALAEEALAEGQPGSTQPDTGQEQQ